MPESKVEKINTDNTERYRWGDNCSGWHFLKKKDLTIIRETMPPGTSEKLHYHELTLQFFYILSGRATFEIDNVTIVIMPNEGIRIDPGSRHRIINAGSAGLEFLVISQPDSHTDRINVE